MGTATPMDENPEKLWNEFTSAHTVPQPPSMQRLSLVLAVVDQAVRQTGGFIRVESTVEKRTTFRVYLPLVSK